MNREEHFALWQDRSSESEEWRAAARREAMIRDYPATDYGLAMHEFVSFAPEDFGRRHCNFLITPRVMCGKPIAADPRMTESAVTDSCSEESTEFDRAYLGFRFGWCLAHAREVQDHVVQTVSARFKNLGANMADERDVCYYLENPIENQIKIGHSRRLRQRVKTLSAEAKVDLRLLATEPGGELVERMRHREFADIRIKGEWFRPSPELLTHIESLKQLSTVGGK